MSIAHRSPHNSRKRPTVCENDSQRLDRLLDMMHTERFTPVRHTCHVDLAGCSLSTLKQLATELGIHLNTTLERLELVADIVRVSNKPRFLMARMAVRGVAMDHDAVQALLSRPVGGSPGATAFSDRVHQRVHAACLVCMEEPLAGDVLKILPCGHVFHSDCVHSWLHHDMETKMDFPSCPTCRASIEHETADVRDAVSQLLSKRHRS